MQADVLTVRAAVEYQAARWLLDVRCRTAQEPELAAWTVHGFSPRAAWALRPQQLHLAALASPDRMGSYQPDVGSRHTLAFGQDAAHPYRLQLFGDERAAVQWLPNQPAA